MPHALQDMEDSRSIEAALSEVFSADLGDEMPAATCVDMDTVL